MANNLKKFTTEAEYTAATLNYPAVSWVTSGDTVHFDKSAPAPTVNDKVMMAWHTQASEDGKDIVLCNAGESWQVDTHFNTITLNDVDVTNDIGNGVLSNYTVGNTDYLAKYELNSNTYTTLPDDFTGDLGGGWGSDPALVDFLIPAQITSIEYLPSNIQNLVVEATTPPTASLGWSEVGTIALYVPTESLTTYQTAWGEIIEVGGSILPISQYSGNLPV